MKGVGAFRNPSRSSGRIAKPPHTDSYECEGVPLHERRRSLPK
nr:MAG TPA: hypothetical protein [Caudoviricetes sp.]